MAGFSVTVHLRSEDELESKTTINASWIKVAEHVTIFYKDLETLDSFLSALTALRASMVERDEMRKAHGLADLAKRWAE